MLRAFIAIKVEASQSLRKVLRTLRDMGRHVRPVDPDALHLTLRFLGQTDEAQVGRIVAAVESAVETEASFSLRIEGLGAFPDSRRPSVIWAGMEQAEPLNRIVVRIDEGLETLGIDRDDRPWRPHLTLARVKSRPPSQLRDLLESQAATPFATQSVSSVDLMQSDLTPAGPQYTVLASTLLTNTP